jgi:hypothetical protein
MEKFHPSVQESLSLRVGKVEKVNAVSEFGFYSVWLGYRFLLDFEMMLKFCYRDDGNPPLINEYAGHLVRTKQFGVDEGGVAAGYSFLDSPSLIN